MKVTKHGFTYTENTPDEVHLCPECQLTMHRIGTNIHTRMILNSIKWDRHYEEYRCDGCGCEGEEYIGCHNLQIRSGLIPLIITIVVSLIVHPLLWYWACWYEDTHHLTEADAMTGVLALLIVFAILTTTYCMARSISELKDDETFTWR